MTRLCAFLVGRFAVLADGDRRRKLARFAAVSVVATVTTSVTLAVAMNLAGLSSVAATVVATTAGAVPAFELSRRWVWSSSGRPKVTRQAAIFWALALIRMVAALGAVKAVTVVAGRWPALERTLAVEAATFAAYGVLWVAQFGVLDRLLFKLSGPEPVGGDAVGVSPAESLPPAA